MTAKYHLVLMKRAIFVLLPILVCGCSVEQQRPADPDLLSAIQQIRAIDDHAHPVRFTRSSEPPDRDFDALPVENMEPESDPVAMRPGNPAVAEAKRALFGGRTRQAVLLEKAEEYPAWVLDQMGVEIMLANRVTMGGGIRPQRFRWVPYADALMYPLDNSGLASRSPDRRLFFPLEEKLLRRYLSDAGLARIPTTLAGYLDIVVTPTLEAHKRGGAVAEKFEAAYLRSVAFDAVERTTAERIYTQYLDKGIPPAAEYKQLQDYLFRFIAAEAGRLGMAMHLHVMGGTGSYFDVEGANPLLLESVLNDSSLRKTNFVMVHGGWPFARGITALLSKPNAYLDFSAEDLVIPPATLAKTIREWLEWVPEKVMFGTDAYPYSDEMGWEESGWIAARSGRLALAIALTSMMRDGEISRERALDLARMVLRDNARRLYGF